MSMMERLGVTWKLTSKPSLGHTTFTSLDLLKYMFQPLAILHSTSTTKRKTWALYQPFSPASTLWKSGSWTVFLSLTLSLLHQHQIGLQPAWHGAGSQGGWTLTHLPKTNLPPIHNSTICGWLIFINEFEWNPTRGQRNKVDSAAWWYVPAVGDWRSRDLLFTMSTASSAWDFPVRQKPAGFALRSLQCHIEEKLRRTERTVAETDKLTVFKDD